MVVPLRRRVVLFLVLALVVPVLGVQGADAQAADPDGNRGPMAGPLDFPVGRHPGAPDPVAHPVGAPAPDHRTTGDAVSGQTASTSALRDSSVPVIEPIGAPSVPRPVRPPAASPLSDEIIKRDCGFSVELAGRDALWVYCDSVDTEQDGSFHYFENSTAAVAVAEDPYTVREPWNFWLRPYPFIVPDPSADPCTGGDRHVVWPSSGTRVPGPKGTDRVIIYFQNLCYDWSVGTLAGFTPVSMGVAEWIHDPRGPAPWSKPIQATILRDELWSSQTPVLGDLGEAAVYGQDGYVYVYACLEEGTCQVARVAHPDVDDPAAYQYLGVGGSWVADPGDAVPLPVIEGTGPVQSFNVVHLDDWDLYAMATMGEPGVYTNSVAVRLAERPEGPWGPPTDFVNASDCDDWPYCYSGHVHSQLSDADTIGLSTFDWKHWHEHGGQVTAFTTDVSVTPPPPGCGTRFSDVGATHPFCREITWFGAEGITTGYTDGTFGPMRNTTRQAMAAWFYRWAGSPPGPFPDPGYSDVTPSNPFYDEIAWFAEQGITEGYLDNTYRPKRAVSRQSMAAWFHRWAGSPAGPFPAPGFPDVKASNPFYDEIAWFAQAGITEGYPDGLFRPSLRLTRQAMAAFFHRYAGN